MRGILRQLRFRLRHPAASSTNWIHFSEVERSPSDFIARLAPPGLHRHAINARSRGPHCTGLLLFSVRRLLFSKTLYTSSLSLRRHLLTSVLSHCHHHQNDIIIENSSSQVIHPVNLIITFSMSRISSMCILFVYMMNVPRPGTAGPSKPPLSSDGFMDDHHIKYIYIEMKNDITSGQINNP